jgi:ribosomal protein L24
MRLNDIVMILDGPFKGWEGPIVRLNSIATDGMLGHQVRCPAHDVLVPEFRLAIVKKS